MAARRPGVYLCKGCGIGEAVAVDALETVASQELGVPLCRRHDCLCSEAGVETIKEDIADGAIDQAVIVACSPRVMTDRFAFVGADAVRANVREQVVWTHPAGDANTRAMAVDQLRMAVAEAANTARPEPLTEAAVSQRILVVGGGLSGLTAAREAARLGHQVLLVERAGELGGWSRRWSRRMPHRPPYRDPQPNEIKDLIAAVTDDPRITVMTDAVVTRTEGMPGRFEVDIRHQGRDEYARVGAIVVATGWRPYDPNKLGHLGYGASPDVVTNVELEDMLGRGPVTRKSDDRPVNAVAFIQCAGSRDPEHLPYCSSICCGISIKQALQILEADRSASVYIIYEELRTPGTAEEFYRQAQEAGVIFMKGKVKSVDKELTVLVDDEFLGEQVPMAGLDLVVLATGMVPNATNPEAAAQERGEDLLTSDINPVAPIEVAGYAAETPAPWPRAEETLPPGGSVLNLQYRQGPHLPVLADGFMDSHFICFPYETRRTGIYTCGPVRAPMGMAEAAEDAAGAVLKAAQAIRNAGEGAALHPRAGDLSIPRFGLDQCTQCGRCAMECPFGAIEIGPDRYPAVAETRCRRCGVCMGACPVRTIDFDNYGVHQISEMIRAVEVPADGGAEPRVLVLACENDAYPALDMAGISRHRFSPFVRIIPVRCLGSVNVSWVTEALAAGYDGVMLMGCKSTDDYQCHFIKGSRIAQERMTKMRDTLDMMMLDHGRITAEEISIADSARVPRVIDNFVATIGELEPNPFKGIE
ncbi:MAG: FAD-dependent oxidoreductase [Kiloniellales bacterium]